MSVSREIRLCNFLDSNVWLCTVSYDAEVPPLLLASWSAADSTGNPRHHRFIIPQAGKIRAVTRSRTSAIFFLPVPSGYREHQALH
jgi:hypothetical protein